MTVFSYGFRTFFLAAGGFAALAILLWLPVFLGHVSLPLAMAARDWHAHEMIFGYAAAAIAGFLLTAIPNWTGRKPVAGRPLMLLAAAWFAGRVGMAISELIGLYAAMALDLLFLPMVALVAGREIVASGNRRNFKLLVILGVLIAANIQFHVEVLREGVADVGLRLGLAVVIALIVLIGGRIVPNFTRNALMREAPGRLPQPFNRFDIACIAVSVAALACWVAEPDWRVTAGLAIAAGLVQLVRLARWAGDRTRGDWLVLVLHLAYAFVPTGFLLAGASALAAAPITGAAAHAWGVGGIGLMTLAVMTRATLGHTGRALAASHGTVLVYVLVLVAALARIAASFPSSLVVELLQLAGIAWSVAFAGFAGIYGPMMVGKIPRVSSPRC
ncbi:MAG: NnrS family protein [Alphaproteobacteria bacterium]|nr:NnrS family protein [Alphaproteobacteria bacterium]